MDTEQILLGIVAGAKDLSVIRRASKELSRKQHLTESLHRLYRYAMNDPGADYSPDVLAAMQKFDHDMVAARPENKEVVVRFRCTENQRRIIQMLADREGKTLSQFIRDKLLAL